MYVTYWPNNLDGVRSISVLFLACFAGNHRSRGPDGDGLICRHSKVYRRRLAQTFETLRGRRAVQGIVRDHGTLRLAFEGHLADQVVALTIARGHKC